MRKTKQKHLRRIKRLAANPIALLVVGVVVLWVGMNLTRVVPVTVIPGVGPDVGFINMMIGTFAYALAVVVSIGVSIILMLSAANFVCVLLRWISIGKGR